MSTRAAVDQPAASPAVANVVAAPKVDVRGMSRLSLGHMFVDLCQGAVPALLPTLIAAHHLNLASATSLVSIGAIGSAVIQPIFGIWSDRITAPWLAPFGVLLAALGIASVGLCHTYPALAAAVAVSGLGVALFHPEGARMAHIVGGGNVKGMSYFSVGGNFGFALGPLAVLLILAIGGVTASPLLAIPGLAIATLLAREVGRLRDHAGAHARNAQAGVDLPEPQWRPFIQLVLAAVARTVPFYALLAFIPIYAIHHLGAAHGLANTLLTITLLGGATGTLIGARCADRFGKRRVLVGAMLPLALLLAILPHLGLAALIVALAATGFAIDAPFATTVVMGQQYLPGRRGLASGITLGFAIGVGGLLATGLGAIADSIGVHATLELLPIFAVIALLAVLTLPDPR